MILVLLFFSAFTALALWAVDTARIRLPGTVYTVDSPTALAYWLAHGMPAWILYVARNNASADTILQAVISLVVLSLPTLVVLFVRRAFVLSHGERVQFFSLSAIRRSLFAFIVALVIAVAPWLSFIIAFSFDITGHVAGFPVATLIAGAAMFGMVAILFALSFLRRQWGVFRRNLLFYVWPLFSLLALTTIAGPVELAVF